MTIRQLRILCTVEEEGGVKAAAHVLKMAQPAISQQLINLAKELGIALHRRVSRGIELTPAGHFFAREAKAIVSQFERLKPVVSNKTPEKDSGSLTIGGNFAVSASLLPDLLGQFRKTHPKLKLQLRTGDRFLLEQMIIADQIELAVINHPPRNRRLVSEICGTDAIVAFVAPDHPLAKKRKINPRDLEHVAFVTRNPAGHKGAGIKYLEVLRKKGLRPDVFMHCESPDGVKVAVLKNNAIGMLFESGVEHEIRQGRFKAIKLPGDELLVANRYIVYHRTRPLSPVGRSFLVFLRESLGGRKATRPVRAIRSSRVKSMSEA